MGFSKFHEGTPKERWGGTQDGKRGDLTRKNWISISKELRVDPNTGVKKKLITPRNGGDQKNSQKGTRMFPVGVRTGRRRGFTTLLGKKFMWIIDDAAGTGGVRDYQSLFRGQ